MNESRRDEELQELMALDAVGALDQDEREELEAAIADRPDLQREHEELRIAAAAMADAVSETPPPTLRASVLDAIADVQQLPAVTDPIDAEPPLAPVVPITSARRWRRWVAVGAAAAAVVAIVAGALVISPLGDSDTDEVAAVIDDPDAVTIDMPATADGGLTGSISIVYSQREDAVVVRGTDLATPPEDGVYQLWAIRDGTPDNAGVSFRPDDGDVELYVPGFDPASAEAWAVTEEPDANSQTPTEPILAITA